MWAGRGWRTEAAEVQARPRRRVPRPSQRSKGTKFFRSTVGRPCFSSARPVVSGGDFVRRGAASVPPVVAPGRTEYIPRGKTTYVVRKDHVRGTNVPRLWFFHRQQWRAALPAEPAPRIRQETDPGGPEPGRRRKGKGARGEAQGPFHPSPPSGRRRVGSNQSSP